MAHKNLHQSVISIRVAGVCIMFDLLIYRLHTCFVLTCITIRQRTRHSINVSAYKYKLKLFLLSIYIQGVSQL